jgi:hypothetical protein
MPRKKSRRAYTKADVKYAVDALKLAGEQPAYFKHSPDGGFRIVFCDPSAAPGKDVPTDDTELAGWDDVVPNGQA